MNVIQDAVKGHSPGRGTLPATKGIDMSDILYVVMPAYNEEGNIKSVVKDWYPILNGKDSASRLVIADTGSTDKTHDYLLEMQQEYPQLEIFTDCEKQHGPKLIALYDYAIKQGADFIFQTDSDGQTDPAEFDAFWQIRNDYTGIFGERPVRGDGKDRAFVEKVVCLLLRIFFGVKVPDANAPFRLMRADSVKKYLYKLPKNYNIPNIMITTYFAHYREKLTFKEISFKPRQAGTNSINVVKIVKIGWQALSDFARFKKDMKYTKISK